jgi:dehydrogenase/reductase SDR family protein 7
MFEVNVFGTINLTRLVVKHWLDTKFPGHVVVTSSTAGKLGPPFSSTYNATKHALHGYFEGLRNEAFPKGIKVTMACPGPVFSEVIEHAFTGQVNTTPGFKHDSTSKRMATARCAYLMAVAMANDVDEAWISIQPVLIFYYAFQYMPSVARTLFPRIMSKERLQRLRDGR